MNYIFIALVATIGLFRDTTTPIKSSTDNFNFMSKQLNFQLTIPIELKEKLVIEESENSVLFKYDNPGYTNDVYLFSINKVSEKVWMEVQGNIYFGYILANQNGFITYSETTRENTLRGKNKDEFEQLLGRVNEIVKTYKEI